MPSWWAASITVLPSATSVFLPSISISSISLRHLEEAAARALHVLGHQAFPVPDVVLELRAEVLDEALHRHGGRIAEGADGAAHDVVGDAVEQVEVLGAPLAVLDAVHDAVEPAGALAAGRALAAGLLEV